VILVAAACWFLAVTMAGFAVVKAEGFGAGDLLTFSFRSLPFVLVCPMDRPKMDRPKMDRPKDI